MEKTIKFGVIGCGLMGREFASASMRWLHLQTDLPRPQIIAACSRTDKSLDWFRRVPDTRYFYHDYHELLENPEVEAVYCAVPHDQHAQIYTDIIRSGKHLLAEKPFGIDLPACQSILTAMREHPQVFVRCSSEFPYYPAAQQLFRWYQEGFFGRVIEARFTIKHASDMDLSKPINWKRQLKTNGAYGCMGDLGIHTQHLPFRLGFRGDSVSAQLANLVPQRPCGDGFAPCETYDNAILLCGAHNAAGDRFPMVMEMKRMAPGCTNTVEYEIYGLDGSAKFSTEDANAVWYTRNQGREQAWSRLILGQRTLFPVITGGIFEFGFSDAMLQMFAAFIAELCGEPCAFGCFRPDEALLSHQLLTGALRAYETGSVVRLD